MVVGRKRAPPAQQALVIGAVVLVVYLLTRTRDLGGDDTVFAMAVDSLLSGGGPSREVFHPHHALFNPLVAAGGWLLRLRGLHPSVRARRAAAPGALPRGVPSPPRALQSAGGRGVLAAAPRRPPPFRRGRRGGVRGSIRGGRCRWVGAGASARGRGRGTGAAGGSRRGRQWGPLAVRHLHGGLRTGRRYRAAMARGRWARSPRPAAPGGLAFPLACWP